MTALPTRANKRHHAHFSITLPAQSCTNAAWGSVAGSRHGPKSAIARKPVDHLIGAGEKRGYLPRSAGWSPMARAWPTRQEGDRCGTNKRAARLQVYDQLSI